jgi:hypothetical protein
MATDKVPDDAEQRRLLEQRHFHQQAVEDLLANTSPIVLDLDRLEDLDEKKLLGFVGERYPGKPCLVSVSFGSAVKMLIYLKR